MEIPPFPEAVARICARDGRYAPEAFIFLNEGLLQTLKQVQEKEKKPRQISGAELAAGLRKHALAQFGPLALTVLNRWGVRTTRDFGEIVFLRGMNDATRRIHDQSATIRVEAGR